MTTASVGSCEDTRNKTLISHEWVESTGGSENVFHELLGTFPDADAACLWNNAPSMFNRPVTESRLSRGPLRGRKALSLPFHASVWRRWNLNGYDTVLASSHAFGHHLAAQAARQGRRGFAYVHTPARYIWAPEVEQRGTGAAVRLASHPLKALDRVTTHADVKYAANSRYIQNRIERSWGRASEVIYPPVQVAKLTATKDWTTKVRGAEQSILDSLPPDGFILGASRLVGYKRLDLAITVGQEMGLPVVIAGAGPSEAELRSQAAGSKVPIVFTGRVSDELLYALYQSALLFVFLPVEDFGIMPVEAMVLGTPVLVNTIGGASESVNVAGGGVAIDVDCGARDLAYAAEQAIGKDMSTTISALDQFSVDSFRQNVSRWLGVAP